MVTVPVAGRRSPATVANVSDFPAPDGPNRTVIPGCARSVTFTLNSPARTVKFASIAAPEPTPSFDSGFGANFDSRFDSGFDSRFDSGASEKAGGWLEVRGRSGEVLGPTGPDSGVLEGKFIVSLNIWFG